MNTTKYNELNVVFIKQLRQEWVHLPAEYVKKNYILTLLKNQLLACTKPTYKHIT